MEAESVPNFCRDVRQILLVFFGNDDVKDAVAIGGECLLLEPTDGQDASAEGYLTRHSNILAHCPAGQRGEDGCRDGDARRGAIFRHGTFGDVDVDILLIEPMFAKPEGFSIGTDIGHRGLHRFTHHFLQLARHVQFAFPRHRRCLNGDDVAADLRPHHAGCNADFIVFFRLRARPLRGAEVVAQVQRRDLDLNVRRVIRHNLPRDFATDTGNRTFQITDTRLARPLVNDFKNRLLGELNVVL